MTAELVAELQQRIDGALWAYRGHPDWEDLRQQAWLRLLQAGRLHPEADLRAFAKRMAQWEALGYFKEGRGLYADHEGLTKAGYDVIAWESLPGFLQPVTPDFAPLLIRRLAYRDAVPWHKFTVRDRWILWQCGAHGMPLQEAARQLGVHYSYVHYRYHWAIKLCRKRSRLPD